MRRAVWAAARHGAHAWGAALSLGAVLCCALSSAWAQPAQPPHQAPDRWWVAFADKPADPHTPAQAYLSQRALDRRCGLGLWAEDTDRPVCPAYLQALQAMGADVYGTTRWFNAAAVRLPAPQALALVQLPFVRAVWPVRVATSPGLAGQQAAGAASNDTAQGWAAHQKAIIGLDSLYRAGWRGQDVWVAVMDNGFHRVDSLAPFAHLFAQNRLLDGYDFVAGNDSVFDAGSHGTAVLSLMAAVDTPVFIGGAPAAHYALYVTEDNANEHRLEETHWLMAAERADSLGVDVFNTSLGYSTFNDPAEDYTYDSMDGQTALITRAADWAASRGILVVNSAGNSGNKDWRYITAPADGDSVLAVGAVDSLGDLAAFSSRGPTADGRIKPDLVGLGAGNMVLRPAGNWSRGNGTSYSSPLVAALGVSLLSAHPARTGPQLKAAMLRSADRFFTPDTNYGYGLPNGPRALTHLAQMDDSPAPSTRLDGDPTMTLYPNPATSWAYLACAGTWPSAPHQVQLTDMLGGRTHTFTVLPADLNRVLPLDLRQLPPAVYAVAVYRGAERVYTGRLVRRP